MVFHFFGNANNHAMSPLFPCINLGPLQPVRVVNVNRFPLGVEINCANSAFAMPVSRGLDAAEGEMHLCSDGRRIYIRDAGIDVAHGTKRPVHVARVDGGREPVRDAVGSLNGLLKILTWHQADYWTEDLFLANAHAGVYISEDGGLEEPSVFIIGASQALSTQFQLCAFTFADVDVFRAGLNLLLIDLRTHVHGFIQPVPHLQALRPVYQAVGKLPVNTFLNDDTAGGGASLARGAK